jgi:hypothetical protein
VVPREFMTQKLYKKELLNAKLNQLLSRTILNASNTELSPTVEEVLVLKELSCFTAH